MVAKLALQPVVGRQIQHQALAAAWAAAGMARFGRHYGQVMAQHLAALAIDFELQLARQAEHQLRVVVAMAEHFVAVMTQGQDREHGSFLGNRRSVTPGLGRYCVIERSFSCHMLFTATLKLV